MTVVVLWPALAAQQLWADSRELPAGNRATRIGCTCSEDNSNFLPAGTTNVCEAKHPPSLPRDDATWSGQASLFLSYLGPFGVLETSSMQDIGGGRCSPAVMATGTDV